MKLSGKVEIAASVETVFDRLADVTSFGRLTGRRGLVIRRTDGGGPPGPGMTWEADFHFRGKERQLAARVTRFQRPELLDFAGQTHGIEVEVSLVIVALTRARTRLQATVEAKPRTLGARLLLQSARLGRSALESRFSDRLETLGRALEARTLA